MKAQKISTILILAACTAAFAQPPSTPPPTPPQQTPPPVRVQPGTIIPGGPQTPAPAVNVAPDAVELSIGNNKIKRAQFEQWVAHLPDQLKDAANGPQKRTVIEQYAELEALA